MFNESMNMAEVVEENTLVEKVLFVLSSMGNVVAKPQYGGTALYKDNVMFAIVDEGAVYFKTEEEEGETYIHLDHELPYKRAIDIADIPMRASNEDFDDFLKMATRSYWLSKKEKVRELEKIEA